MLHEFVTPQKNGVVRLPPDVRSGLHLDEPGAQVEIVQLADGEFLLRGVLPVPADQAWFWTERWQQMEREADADIAAGRTEVFESVEDFLADLDA